MATGFIMRPLPLPTVTASSTALGYSVANVNDDRIGKAWRSATGSSATLTIDLGADTTFDTIALFGLLGAQDDWLWSVDLATAAQGGFSGSFWAGDDVPLLAGSVMPVSGLGKALWLAPDDAPAQARYVRITFSGLSSEAVQVSRVCLGERFTPEINFSYGAALGIRPLGNSELSSRGALIRRVGPKKRGVGVSLAAATLAEAEGVILPLLERVGNDSNVVLVTDPEAHAQRQNRMYYGFLTGDLGAIYAGFNRFTTSFNVIEEG